MLLPVIALHQAVRPYVRQQHSNFIRLLIPHAREMSNALKRFVGQSEEIIKLSNGARSKWSRKVY